jgi:hypothetical protein
MRALVVIGSMNPLRAALARRHCMEREVVPPAFKHCLTSRALASCTTEWMSGIKPSISALMRTSVAIRVSILACCLRGLAKAAHNCWCWASVNGKNFSV